MEIKSDESIMQKAKDGDVSAIRLLFERYNVAIFNFFRKLGADRERSEDLTQDLFYRVIKYRSSYNSHYGSFKSWIYQMARNIFSDDTVKFQKSNRLFRSVENYEQELFNKHQVSNTEVADDSLGYALSQLSPNAREIIILSRYAGFKYEEIARMKSSSEGAVKTQVFRAMKELRDIYFKVVKV